MGTAERVRVQVTDKHTGKSLPAVIDDTRFQKGHTKRGGRKPGSTNRHTALLKDAIIAAGTSAGEQILDEAIRETRRLWRIAKRHAHSNEDTLYETLQKMKAYRDGGPDMLTEYLKWMALNHPKTYGALLGRVLPFHLTAKVDHSHREYNSKEEIMERLKEAGVPIHTISN
jgi:hypothetical protein